MADLKDLAEGMGANAGSKAALAAGKQQLEGMAKRALEDLTLSPEEKAQRDEEAKAKRKMTLIKLGAVGVVGVVGVLALMSVLAKLWLYALGLLVVGGLGAGGYFYAKPKVKALKERAQARLTAQSEARAAEERERAVRDAAAAKQQKLEDELLALKKKAQ